MDINVAFCRRVLQFVMIDVKPVTTPEQRREAWVYKTSFGDYEFHGPDDFYWSGSADNAYDARSKGWNAWLVQRLVDTARGV